MLIMMVVMMVRMVGGSAAFAEMGMGLLCVVVAVLDSVRFVPSSCWLLLDMKLPFFSFSFPFHNPNIDFGKNKRGVRNQEIG